MAPTTSTFVPGPIGVVVVTRDRRALLERCLAALAAQERRPDRFYVIDNASSDDTPAYLADSGWTARADVTCIRSETNLGGAGGFALGLERARADGCAWIWLLDDDTLPQPDALARLCAGIAAWPPGMIAVACSRVDWRDGSLHRMNLVGPKSAYDREFFYEAAGRGHISIRTASFVSVMFSSEVVDAGGLQRREYFLWNDDIEYTARCLRHRRGICVPASVVLHDTATNGGTLDAPPARFRYHIRNQLWMLKKSPAFSRREKLKILPVYLAVCAAWSARAPLTRIPFALGHLCRALLT